MAYKNSLITGITDLLVLSILDREDSYVYEITKMISSYSDGLLSISLNTIYTATYKLEGENLISEYPKQVGKKRTRIYYHLEPKGKNYLEKLTQEYADITDGVQKLLHLLRKEKNTNG